MSAVETCARSAPLRATQRLTNARVFGTSRRDAETVVGTDQSLPQNRSWLPSSAKHRTCADSPVPRGSQLTRSNRPSVSESSSDNGAAFSVATPGTPGPPKLTNSDPIRCAGRRTRKRTTASEIVGPRGFAQSSGTCTRAHWSRTPQLRQSMRVVIRVPCPAGAPAPAARTMPTEAQSSVAMTAADAITVREGSARTLTCGARRAPAGRD